MAFARGNNDWIPTGPTQSKIMLAWAGGFFDGEGCICAVTEKRDDRPNGSFRLRVMIGQNDLATLDRFRRAVNVRCAINAVGQRPNTNRPMYYVHYDGLQAFEVLQRLGRYLFRKAPEAQVAKQLWVRGRLGGRPGSSGWPLRILSIRRALVAELCALKGRKPRKASG